MKLFNKKYAATQKQNIKKRKPIVHFTKDVVNLRQGTGTEPTMDISNIQQDVKSIEIINMESILPLEDTNQKKEYYEKEANR